MDGWGVFGGGNPHAHAAHMHVKYDKHGCSMVVGIAFEIIMFDMYAHVCVYGALLYTPTIPFTHPPPTKGEPPNQ